METTAPQNARIASISNAFLLSMHARKFPSQLFHQLLFQLLAAILRIVLLLEKDLPLRFTLLSLSAMQAI
jgi:hypothetical protein